MATKLVTQESLAEIVLLRQRVEELEAVKKTLKAKEEEVLTIIKRRGSTVESGALTAHNAQWERSTVQWKEAFIERLGADEAAKVAAATPAKTYDKLVVEPVAHVKVATVTGEVSFGPNAH